MKVSDISVEYLGGYGDDISVVNAARVSFGKHTEKLEEGDERLIHYLARHKHHSPFNHAFLSFRVKAPIFVARQLVKHKFMPWNEVSRRYVTEEPEFYFPQNYRLKADNVKQGSSEEISPHSESFKEEISPNTKYILAIYKDMLNHNVCPEQARMVLPQNTMTEWVWSGTLGAFLDMLKLRLDPHTQKETRDVAELIAERVEFIFPVSYKAYLND